MLDRLRRLAWRRPLAPANEKGDSNIDEKTGAVRLQMSFDNDSDSESIGSTTFSYDEKNETEIASEKDSGNHLHDIAPLAQFLESIQPQFPDIKIKPALALAHKLCSSQIANVQWAQLKRNAHKLSGALDELNKKLHEDVRRNSATNTLHRHQIQLLRDLTNAESAKYQRRLSQELQSFAVCLCKKEQQEERLSSQLEAITHLRQCADREGTTRRRRMLARALGTYAGYLRVAGVYVAADSVEDESLKIFRDHLKEGLDTHLIHAPLDQSEPPRFEPVVVLDRVLHVAHLQLLRHVREMFQRYPGMEIYRLACALERSTASHWEATNDAVAMERCKEVVFLYRALVKHDSHHFVHKLGGALRRLAKILQASEDFEGAVKACEESVEIYRAVAKRYKGYRVSLMLSLCRLGQCQAAAKSFQSAYATTTEAVDVTAQLMKKSPKDTIAQNDHITALVHYAEVRTKAWVELSGRSEEGLSDRLLEACKATTEALVLRRKMLAETPSKWTPVYLAISLENHSIPLRLAGKHEEAMETSLEALGIWRKLYDESPGTYRHNVAISLSFHRDTLNAAGNLNAALDVVKEEIALFNTVKAECGDYWIHEKRLERAIKWKDYFESVVGPKINKIPTKSRKRVYASKLK